MKLLREPLRVVCLVPVRNEAWILREFLAAASLWADNIIVADQGSTDGSCEIVQACPRAKLISNAERKFNEGDRQRLLLTEARKLEGPKILVALDADEFLSPALTEPKVVADLAAAGPGAVVRVPLMNVRDDYRRGWIGYTGLGVAWFDNGRAHVPEAIHSYRLPVRKEDPEVKIEGAALLHWQFTAMERMRAKHRWYLLWERINRPERDPIRLYRQYFHMDAISESELFPFPADWLDWYEQRGVAIRGIRDDGFRWWDKQALDWIEQKGARTFAREAVWDFDWVAAARRAGRANPERFADPRTAFQRWVHGWLRRTQPRNRAISVRGGDKILRLFFHA